MVKALRLLACLPFAVAGAALNVLGDCLKFFGGCLSVLAVFISGNTAMRNLLKGGLS